MNVLCAYIFSRSCKNTKESGQKRNSESGTWYIYWTEKGYVFCSYCILLDISTCWYPTCWIYFVTFNFSTMASQYKMHYG